MQHRDSRCLMTLTGLDESLLTQTEIKNFILFGSSNKNYGHTVSKLIPLLCQIYCHFLYDGHDRSGSDRIHKFRTHFLNFLFEVHSGDLLIYYLPPYQMRFCHN